MLCPVLSDYSGPLSVLGDLYGYTGDAGHLHGHMRDYVVPPIKPGSALWKAYSVILAFFSLDLLSLIQVGLEKIATEDTKLIYMTTGVLLQKIVGAKSLMEFTHIFIDEVGASLSSVSNSWKRDLI